MAFEPSDTPRFFVLQKGSLESRYDVDAYEVEGYKAEPVNHGEAARCPKCGSAIGMLPWRPPYRARLELHGKELGDFIECPGDELLVSERFAQAFREEGLRGLEGFHPVEIVRVSRKQRGPKPSSIPRYLVVSPCFGPGRIQSARQGRDARAMKRLRTCLVRATSRPCFDVRFIVKAMTSRPRLEAAARQS